MCVFTYVTITCNIIVKLFVCLVVFMQVDLYVTVCVCLDTDTSCKNIYFLANLSLMLDSTYGIERKQIYTNESLQPGTRINCRPLASGE